MHLGFIEKIFTAPAVVVHPEDVQERRLPSARWTHDRNEVAFLDIQIDLAQDVEKFLLPERITAFQILETDHTFIRRVMLGLDSPA